MDDYLAEIEKDQNNMFSQMSVEDQYMYMIDISMVEKVLSSKKLMIDIPNYVNGRPTHINAELIKASVWLMTKSVMTNKEIHNCLLAYETKCKQLRLEELPLNIKVINASLRHMGKVIPNSLFRLWC